MSGLKNIRKDLIACFKEAVETVRVNIMEDRATKIDYRRTIMMRDGVNMDTIEDGAKKERVSRRSVDRATKLAKMTAGDAKQREKLIEDVCRLLPHVRKVLYPHALELTYLLTDMAKVAGAESQGLALSATRQVMGAGEADKMKKVFLAENASVSPSATRRTLKG